MPYQVLHEVDDSLQRELGVCNVLVNFWLSSHIENADPQEANETFLATLHEEQVRVAIKEEQLETEPRVQRANQAYHHSRSDSDFEEILRSHRSGMPVPLVEQAGVRLSRIVEWLQLPLGSYRGLGYFIGLSGIEHAVGVVKFTGGLLYYDPNSGRIYGCENIGDVLALISRSLEFGEGSTNLEAQTGMAAVYRLK